MDLSVLIPAYNQSCLQLVRSLQQQCRASGASYEIIVADDGSTDEAARRENAAAGELEGCRAIMQPQNRGRAATRNLLVSHQFVNGASATSDEALNVGEAMPLRRCLR